MSRKLDSGYLARAIQLSAILTLNMGAVWVPLSSRLRKMIFHIGAI